MWLGFGIAVAIELLNGLNVYFPDVPAVPLLINTGPLFTEAPWNQMAPMQMQVWPLFVGLTYLLTSEVSFSLWFFLWLIQLELIAAYYLGYTPASLPSAIGSSSDGGARTFMAYQQVGGYLAYVALVLWTGREHFAHIVRRALRRAPAASGEAREALSYPLAFWGFVLSFAFMIAWSVAAGMRVDVALVFWVLYLVTVIALTRVVVEGGFMFINQGWVPLGTMAQLTGSGAQTWLSPESLVPASYMQAAFLTDMRAFLMPSFVQSFKLAHDERIPARPLWLLFIAVTLIALAMSLWMNVRLGYEYGGLKFNLWFAVVGPQLPARNAVELLHGAQNVSWTNWWWLAAGMAITAAVMLARSRFLWFPLHPLGFLICLTAPNQRVWFSLFLGWLCKVLILRFGGHDTYRKLLPGFLGVVLGDVTMMLFWLVVDGWQGRTGHLLVPG